MSLLNVLDSAVAEHEGEPTYFEPLREQSFVEAIPLLRQAMCVEDGQAMGLYAALLALGHGIEQNLQEAVDWFRQGAVRGDSFSQFSFGVCLTHGLGLPANHMEAAYWLFKAGCAGNSKAISLLSDIAGKNPGVIGPHFSVEAYHDLMTQLRRPALVH
jgi:TPR repeat protein